MQEKLLSGEFSKSFHESAAREGIGGIADGVAPVALNGVSSIVGAGE